MLKSRAFKRNSCFQPFSTVRAEKNDDKAESGDEGDATEEYEPEVDFKPVVALPDLVEVKTGEEDEDVSLSTNIIIHRFFRFCSLLELSCSDSTRS